MKLKILLTIVFLAVVLILFFFWRNKSVSENRKTNFVCFNSRCFSVETASSFMARAKGLMFREKLDSGSGMLFVFPNNAKHAFWMKNTLIPLDIIWINADKEAVYIAKNVQPCKISNCPAVYPDKPARYVLELNAGKTDEIGLKPGDKIEFDLR